MTNELTIYRSDSIESVGIESPIKRSPIINADATVIQWVATRSLSDSLRPSPKFKGTTDLITPIQKSTLNHVRSALKLHLLLVLPLIGWIAFVIAQIAIKHSWACYKPTEKEGLLITKINQVGSGLSDARVKKLAHFILQKTGTSSPGVISYHHQSNFLGMAGTLPRDVIQLGDGRFLIKVYSRILATGDATIHRGILIDPANPEKTGYVQIKESKNTIAILDPSAAHSLDENDLKPVDCYIINNRSDVSSLYPEVLDPKNPDKDEYVDIAFHAKQKKGAYLDRLVTFAQNIGSWGNVNRAIVHVDMIHGRVKQDVLASQTNAVKETKNLLMISSATGTVGTFTEYALDPKKLGDGEELHIFRFKKGDLQREGVLKVMHDFAKRQVNRMFLPAPQINEDSIHNTDIMDEYPRGYIPDLYSFLDAGLCPISSIRYDECAKDRIAESAADELLEQRRQSDNKLLGGICSAFTSLTIQIGLFLGLLSDKYKATLVEDSVDKAKKELSRSATALKKAIEERFNDGIDCSIEQSSPVDVDPLEKLIYPDYSKLLNILGKAVINTKIKSELSAIEFYKKKLKKLYIDEFKKVKKRHLYKALKRLLEKAEERAVDPQSLESRIAPVVKDPLFRVHSRFIMPSTLHGLMTRHKMATIQIVPPASTT